MKLTWYTYIRGRKQSCSKVLLPFLDLALDYFHLCTRLDWTIKKLHAPLFQKLTHWWTSIKEVLEEWTQCTVHQSQRKAVYSHQPACIHEYNIVSALMPGGSRSMHVLSHVHWVVCYPGGGWLFNYVHVRAFGWIVFFSHACMYQVKISTNYWSTCIS